jgi:hypothetical protein
VDYRKYQELVEKRDKFGKEIAANIDSYKGAYAESARFLQKISEMNFPKPESRLDKFIVDTKDFIRSQQERALYKIALEHHIKTEGYGLYVSYSMLNNYIDSKGLKIEPESHIKEYASMQVQKAFDHSNIKEVTPEVIETSLKQVLCFEELKNALGRKELTPE